MSSDLPIPGVPTGFKVSKTSAALIRPEWDAIGAIMTGRRDVDMSEAWDGIPPLGVTHLRFRVLK